MITEAWTQMRFHALQSQLWCTKKRFCAAACGRGSGKTELARRRVIRYLPVQKRHHDPMYFFALPTRQQAKRVAWGNLKSLVPPSWLARKNAISESDLTIKTEFGSTLHLVGMDKPQRIEGNQWDGGIIDECSDQRPGAFGKSVVPALSHRNGWCWRIGVPKRQGIGAADFRSYFEQANTTDDIEAYTWPSADILTEEQLQWAKNNLDSKDFDEQYNASWLDSGGSIFYPFDPELHVTTEAEYVHDQEIMVGSDFNVDPMSWVIGHVSKNEIRIFDEIFMRDSHTQLAMDALHVKHGSHKAGWAFYGDATGRARKSSATRTDYIIIKNDTRFKPMKIKYSKSNPPVRARFAACNAMLLNAMGEVRLKIHPRCVNLIADLKARSYKSGTSEPDDFGDIGHITDALGYPIFRLFPIRTSSNARPEIFTSK